LNTLANHGYINRHGRDLEMYDVAHRQEEVFGINPNDIVGVTQALIKLGLEHEIRDNKTYYDLGSLFNHEDGVDVDVTLFTVDNFFEENAPPSADLFQDFVELCQDEGSDKCTLQHLVNYQIARMAHSCANNPHVFDKRSGRDWATGRTNSILFNLVLQSHPLETFSLGATVDLSDLESFAIGNRLPENFVTSYERGFQVSLSDPDVTATAQAIIPQLCDALATVCPSAPQCV